MKNQDPIDHFDATMKRCFFGLLSFFLIWNFAFKCSDDNVREYEDGEKPNIQHLINK